MLRCGFSLCNLSVVQVGPLRALRRKLMGLADACGGRGTAVEGREEADARGARPRGPERAASAGPRGPERAARQARNARPPPPREDEATRTRRTRRGAAVGPLRCGLRSGRLRSSSVLRLIIQNSRRVDELDVLPDITVANNVRLPPPPQYNAEV